MRARCSWLSARWACRPSPRKNFNCFLSERRAVRREDHHVEGEAHGKKQGRSRSNDHRRKSWRHATEKGRRCQGKENVTEVDGPKTAQEGRARENALARSIYHYASRLRAVFLLEPTAMKRAYSLFTVKSVDEEQRVIEGIA